MAVLACSGPTQAYDGGDLAGSDGDAALGDVVSQCHFCGLPPSTINYAQAAFLPHCGTSDGTLQPLHTSRAGPSWTQLSQQLS